MQICARGSSATRIDLTTPAPTCTQEAARLPINTRAYASSDGDGGGEGMCFKRIVVAFFSIIPREQHLPGGPGSSSRRTSRIMVQNVNVAHGGGAYRAGGYTAAAGAPAGAYQRTPAGAFQDPRLGTNAVVMA